MTRTLAPARSRTDLPSVAIGRFEVVTGALHTFAMMLLRDVIVTGRQLGSFAAQVLIQPFFMLFIFGHVLTAMGFVAPGFAQVLLPGIVALSGFLTSIQSTASPLVVDFSWTREIDDRLLAPAPVGLVAIGKIVFGALRGLVAAVVMIPIGLLMLDEVSWNLAAWPLTLGLLALGCLSGASLGLVLGTLVPPSRIQLAFAVILTPLMFTGSTQFPWHGLGEMRWYQVVCALNPLTYLSEGMRAHLSAALLPSIPLPIDVLCLLLSIVVFGAIGIWGFTRRARD
ncbi:ABC transporter permease [Amycolatopsis pittospori]|uniref:ABC transporter permease n=1 Tax=Amycolatopsis pittospori TaxID=2749434 RepID=UPI0015F0E24E|nr:ABC transporter permease [Amycolatopsis pittospori]